MKKWKMLILLAVSASMLAITPAHAYKNKLCKKLNKYYGGDMYNEMEVVGWTLFTSTSTVPVTTSVISCALFDNMEANRDFIEKEAIMVREEGMRYEPSFLATYADQKGINDLQTAADDVLKNSIHE